MVKHASTSDFPASAWIPSTPSGYSVEVHRRRRCYALCLPMTLIFTTPAISHRPTQLLRFLVCFNQIQNSLPMRRKTKVSYSAPPVLQYRYKPCQRSSGSSECYLRHHWKHWHRNRSCQRFPHSRDRLWANLPRSGYLGISCFAGSSLLRLRSLLTELHLRAINCTISARRYQGERRGRPGG